MLWSYEWLLTARCLATNNSSTNIRPEPRSTTEGFYIEQTALSTLKTNPINQASSTHKEYLHTDFDKHAAERYFRDFIAKS
jgi:hypothetical protein